MGDLSSIGWSHQDDSLPPLNLHQQGTSLAGAFLAHVWTPADTEEEEVDQGDGRRRRRMKRRKIREHEE